MWAPGYRMFLRLGVYQDLCREHEHAKSSLWMLTLPGTRAASRSVGRASFPSQRWSVTHLLLSAAGPLPWGPCGGMGFASSSLPLGWVWWGWFGPCWIPTAKQLVLARAPDRVRDCMGHGDHGFFGLQDTLLSKAGKNTSYLHRHKTCTPVVLLENSMFLWNEKKNGIPLLS